MFFGVLERPVLRRIVRKSNKVLEPEEDNVRWTLKIYGTGIPDFLHLVHCDIGKQLFKGQYILVHLEKSVLGMLKSCFFHPLLIWWVPRFDFHGLDLNKVHHQLILLNPGGEVIMLHLTLLLHFVGLRISNCSVGQLDVESIN